MAKGLPEETAEADLEQLVADQANHGQEQQAEPVQCFANCRCLALAEGFIDVVVGEQVSVLYVGHQDTCDAGWLWVRRAKTPGDEGWLELEKVSMLFQELLRYQ